jgi:hypothetical protein
VNNKYFAWYEMCIAATATTEVHGLYKQLEDKMQRLQTLQNALENQRKKSIKNSGSEAGAKGGAVPSLVSPIWQQK